MKLSQEPITDLQEAFRLLDPKGLGHIEPTELQFICRRLGENLTIEEVKDMVSEALIGFEGKIFYDGLLKILITQ
jgi:Ca2+-binding EF-hand superfamily protein